MENNKYIETFLKKLKENKTFQKPLNTSPKLQKKYHDLKESVLKKLKEAK